MKATLRNIRGTQSPVGVDKNGNAFISLTVAQSDGTMAVGTLHVVADVGEKIANAAQIANAAKLNVVIDLGNATLTPQVERVEDPTTGEVLARAQMSPSGLAMVNIRGAGGNPVTIKRLADEPWASIEPVAQAEGF